MTNKNLKYSPYKSSPQIVQDLLQLPKTPKAIMNYFEGVDIVVLDFVEEQLYEILGSTIYRSPEFRHVYFGIEELREELRAQNLEVYENTLPEVIHDINVIAELFIHPFTVIEMIFKANYKAVTALQNQTESEFRQDIEDAVHRIKRWYESTASALKVMELELLDVKINYPKDRRRVSIDPTFVVGEYKLSYNNITLYFTFDYIRDTMVFFYSFDPSYPKQHISFDALFTVEDSFVNELLMAIFDVDGYY